MIVPKGHLLRFRELEVDLEFGDCGLGYFGSSDDGRRLFALEGERGNYDHCESEWLEEDVFHVFSWIT
jgi:hypothetical protein